MESNDSPEIPDRGGDNRHPRPPFGGYDYHSNDNFSRSIVHKQCSLGGKMPIGHLTHWIKNQGATLGFE